MLRRWAEPADWWDQAASRGVGVEVFFPTTGIKRVPREAAELCAGCPVRADCAKVGSSVRAGVWAGHLAGHYRPKRRRRASAAPVAR